MTGQPLDGAVTDRYFPGTTEARVEIARGMRGDLRDLAIRSVLHKIASDWEARRNIDDELELGEEAQAALWVENEADYSMSNLRAKAEEAGWDHAVGCRHAHVTRLRIRDDGDGWPPTRHWEFACNECGTFGVPVCQLAECRVVVYHGVHTMEEMELTRDAWGNESYPTRETLFEVAS